MKQLVIVISDAHDYDEWLIRYLGTRLFGEPELRHLNYPAKYKLFALNDAKGLRKAVSDSLHAFTIEVKRLQSTGLQVIAIAIDQCYEPDFVSGVYDLSRTIGNPPVLFPKVRFDENDPFFMVHRRVNHYTIEPIQTHVPEETAT